MIDSLTALWPIKAMPEEWGFKTVLNIHRYYPLTIFPSLTFYLQITPEESLKRQRGGQVAKDYFEKKGIAFYRQLVEGYRRLKILFPQRIVPIDGEQSFDVVSSQIFVFLDSHLRKK